eukprot:1395276-Ditylum_brightwellii.AAC.1
MSGPNQDDVPPPLLPRQVDNDIKELNNEYLKCIIFDNMDMMLMNKNVYDPDIVNKLPYPNRKNTQAQQKQFELQYIEFCKKCKLTYHDLPA